MQPSESAAVELENEILLPCPEAEEQSWKATAEIAFVMDQLSKPGTGNV